MGASAYSCTGRRDAEEEAADQQLFLDRRNAVATCGREAESAVVKLVRCGRNEIDADGVGEAYQVGQHVSQFVADPSA